MQIALSPGSAARVRSVLGDAVDLSPAAVPAALARLAEQAPEVYSDVLSQLSGSHIRLDSERALHRRHRQSLLRRALFGWGEYESDAGDRLIVKRRVAAAVPLALAALMLAAAGVSGLVKHRHRTATPSMLVQPSGAASVRANQGARSVLKPLVTWRPLAAAGPAPAATRGSVRVSSVLRLPPVPALSFPAIPSDLRAAERALPSPIVFSRVTGSADTPFAARDPAPTSPIVYVRDVRDATDGVSGRRETPDTRGARAVTIWKTGDRIAARLVTAIVVASGVPPVPVIAEGADGSTWLGYAQAQVDGRVHVAFRPAESEVDPSRRSAAPPAGPSVMAVALEADQLSVGLLGRVVVRRRASAAAAIAALVQAASDYMQAAARAGQITVSAGGGELSVGTAPPGWTFAASRFADMLNPQGPSGTVETLEVPAGTRCVILVTGTP